jgi:predicted metal-binding membrane protein
MGAVASPSGLDEVTAGRAGLAPAFVAARARLGLIAVLFGLAAVAWWSTAERMRGMDDGPGSDLGALGWFLGVWLVMMAAMMFPSVSPTVALYAQMVGRRAPAAPFVFAAGYLATWTAAGLLAYGIFHIGRNLLGDELAWGSTGRWLAGGTLVLAAAYELTPMKDVCLAKCRSPLGFLLGSWRDGRWGALAMGARHGAWCLGCCWALMASLFALGVMSLAWMAFVAALIALEKTVPWGRAVTYMTAALLLVLGVALLAAPDVVPGLTIPDDGGAMRDMGGADPMRGR